ncbi:MAG: type II toxin-antitoxin system HicB family antitoxin [Candidatus Methylacidiphilales bacterium]|jgi:predicted RNase H-like HicB family nuclease
MELVFSVTQEEDGGFVAECLSEAIFTQADSWEELKRMVKDAVQTHFFDQPEKAKSTIRLHFVRDEVLSGV